MTPNIREAGQGNPLRKSGRGIPLLIMLLLFTSPAFAEGGKDEVTPGEIALYVGLIIAVIVLAWLLNTVLSKKTDPPHPPHAGKHHHHHHHHGHHHRHQRPVKRTS